MGMPKGSVTANGVPALVLDILGTHWGSWHSIDELTVLVADVRPDRAYPPETVARSVHRLVNRGLVERRHREHSFTNRSERSAVTAILEVRVPDYAPAVAA